MICSVSLFPRLAGCAEWPISAFFNRNQGKQQVGNVYEDLGVSFLRLGYSLPVGDGLDMATLG